MLKQEEFVFIKAISTLQISPALLREQRMALSWRKKKPVVLPGSSGTTSGGGGTEPPYDHLASSWASPKPTSWQVRVIQAHKLAANA